jgi:hypothetical protein
VWWGCEFAFLPYLARSSVSVFLCVWSDWTDLVTQGIIQKRHALHQDPARRNLSRLIRWRQRRRATKTIRENHEVGWLRELGHGVLRKEGAVGVGKRDCYFDVAASPVSRMKSL